MASLRGHEQGVVELRKSNNTFIPQCHLLYETNILHECTCRLVFIPEIELISLYHSTSLKVGLHAPKLLLTSLPTRERTKKARTSPLSNNN